MSEPRISNVAPKTQSAPAQAARRQGSGAASTSAGTDPFSVMLAQSVESLEARGSSAPEAKTADGTGESADAEGNAAANAIDGSAAAAASNASAAQTADAHPPVDPASLTKELVLDPALRGDAGALATSRHLAEGDAHASGGTATGRLPSARRPAGPGSTGLTTPASALRAESAGNADSASSSTQLENGRPLENGLLRAVEQANPRADGLERFTERFDALTNTTNSSTPSTGPIPNGVANLNSSAALQRYEAPPTYATFSIATPLDTPAWPEQFGHVARVMSRDEISSAEVRVHPAELGPIEVRLAIEGDRAEISFAAASPETRALLEAHMPKLREAMESAGLQLSQSSVQAGPDRDTRQSGTSASGSASGGERRNDVTAEPVTEVRVVRRSDRMVDVFA